MALPSAVRRAAGCAFGLWDFGFELRTSGLGPGLLALLSPGFFCCGLALSVSVLESLFGCGYIISEIHWLLYKFHSGLRVVRDGGRATWLLAGGWALVALRAARWARLIIKRV